jgi:hypothetical protein
METVPTPLQVLKRKLRTGDCWAASEATVLAALQAGDNPETICMAVHGQCLLAAALMRGWQTVVDFILSKLASQIHPMDARASRRALWCVRNALTWCLEANVRLDAYTLSRMLGLCAGCRASKQQLLHTAAAIADPCDVKTAILQQFQAPVVRPAGDSDHSLGCGGRVGPHPEAAAVAPSCPSSPSTKPQKLGCGPVPGAVILRVKRPDFFEPLQ